MYGYPQDNIDVLQFENEIFLICVLTFLDRTKQNEISIRYRCTKACFVCRITQKISDILWIILRNSWICILNCVSWFVSIILNFIALCDLYTLQIQSYTMLLKRNRIFCLIWGITFGSHILTVSHEGDDHLWIYFVYCLNYSRMYEEPDC